MQTNNPSNHQLSSSFPDHNPPPIIQSKAIACPHCQNTVLKSQGQYQEHIKLNHLADKIESFPMEILIEPSHQLLDNQEMKKSSDVQEVVGNEDHELQADSLSESLNQNYEPCRYRIQNQSSDLAHQNFANAWKPTSENIHQHSRFIQERYPDLSSSIAQEQEKQFNFRHLKVYVQHKMSPFYRQFDIQPIRNQNPHNQKSSRSQAYHKLFKQSPINPQDSFAYLCQSSFQDQKKIHLELDARLLPIQNAFVGFISNYIKQNTIGYNRLENGEAITSMLFQKVSTLQRLVYSVHEKELGQMRGKTQEEDFMQTDLFRSINSFMMFLSQKLRFYENWIVQSMGIIVMDTMIEYYVRNKEEMYENLKVSNFSYLYSHILLNTQSKKYDLPFPINYLTMSQFLMYFNQWCSVIQYINNKRKVDYIEPLKKQIDYINELYRENVTNFRKCTKNRRATYQERMKKKFIEKKENDRKVKKEHGMDRDLRQKFKNWKINPNIQERVDGDGYEIIPNTSKVVDTNSYLPFSKYAKSKQSLAVKEPLHYQGFNLPSNNPSEQRHQFRQIFAPIISHEQKNHPKEAINSRSNDPLNDYESQQQSSRQFIPKKSEYVNYFSRQKQEERQKFEHDWNASIKLFRMIMTDSRQFKPIMKQKIRKQLQETYSLYSNITKPVLKDFDAYIRVKRQLKAVLSKYPNESTTQSLPVQEVVPQTVQPLRTQVTPVVTPPMKDPFVAIKNFRFKSPSERIEAVKRAKFVEENQKLNEKEIQNQQYNENENDVPNNKIIEEDPFDALV